MLNSIPFNKFISVKKFKLIKTRKVFGITIKHHSTPYTHTNNNTNNKEYIKDIDEHDNISNKSNKSTLILYNGDGKRVKFNNTPNNILINA